MTSPPPPPKKPNLVGLILNLSLGAGLASEYALCTAPEIKPAQDVPESLSIFRFKTVGAAMTRVVCGLWSCFRTAFGCGVIHSSPPCGARTFVRATGLHGRGLLVWCRSTGGVAPEHSFLFSSATLFLFAHTPKYWRTCRISGLSPLHMQQTKPCHQKRTHP